MDDFCQCVLEAERIKTYPDLVWLCCDFVVWLFDAVVVWCCSGVMITWCGVEVLWWYVGVVVLWCCGDVVLWCSWDFAGWCGVTPCQANHSVTVVCCGAVCKLQYNSFSIPLAGDGLAGKKTTIPPCV